MYMVYTNVNIMNTLICTDVTPNLLGLFNTIIPPALLYYAYIPIALVAIIFGLFVFLKNPKDIKSRLLLALSITFSLLIFNEILQWTAVRADLNYLGWELSAFFQSTLVALVVYFSWVYFKEKGLSFKQKMSLLSAYIPTILLLPTHWNIATFDLVKCEGVNGPLWFYIYALEILAIVFIGVIGVHYSRKTTEPNFKRQIKLLTIASTLFLSIFTATNIVGDVLSFYDVNLIGPIGMVLFIGFLAFIIVRFQVFSIKLIGTQTLVASVIFLTGAQIFTASGTAGITVSILTFILSLAFGYFLIRSVKKEVEAREKIEALAQSLDVKNTELKTANDNQSNLIHVMNHQIKGRLGNSRNIFAELLTEDYGKMPDAARPLLEQGLQETTTGVNYVTTILKGASAESGTLPYTFVPMDFKSLISDVVEKQKTFAERKGLQCAFTIEDGMYQINGDAAQIGEAVKNLIDNSINYTPSGSISISLDHKDGKIIFAVKDTGVGITDEDKSKLFRSGGRGKDSISINVNSTGYGLAFVKGVVTAHGGHVWAESEGKGNGSQFYVELPGVK